MQKKSFFLLLIVVLLFTPFFVQAQTKKQPLKFENQSIFLGRFKDTVNIIPFQFSFVNQTDSTVEIKQLIEDCACSELKAEKKQFSANEKGEIKGTFEPYQSGAFTKKFVVVTKGKTDTVNLEIHGFIEPYHIAPEMAYPVNLDGLLTTNKYIYMGTISDTTVFRKEVSFYNRTDKPIEFADTFAAPQHIFIKLDSGFVIPPKSLKKVLVYYHSEIKQELGPIHDHIDLFIKKDGDTSFVRQPFSLTGFVMHHVKQSELVNGNPNIWVNKKKIYLGKVPRDSVKVATFTVRNDSQDELIIHSVASGVGCKVLPIKQTHLHVGETTEVQIAVEYLSKDSFQKRRAYLFTNDPENSTIELEISISFYRSRR